MQEKTKIITTIICVVLLFSISIFKVDVRVFSFLKNFFDGSYKEQFALMNNVAENNSSSSPIGAIKKCSYETTSKPTHQGALFYEIAWMGDNSNTINEWVSLKKTDSDQIDISNWQIVNQSGKLKIFIPKNKILNNKSPYYFISRQIKISGITPNQIFSGIIKNSNEGLRLFNNNCILIDEVIASPNWPAGNSKTKKPMVRLPDLSWQTKGEIVAKKEAIQIVTSEPPKCININTASSIELQKITHVGPKLAEKIILIRNEKMFLTMDDLIKVKGIGSSTLDDIKKQGIACL